MRVKFNESLILTAASNVVKLNGRSVATVTLKTKDPDLMDALTLLSTETPTGLGMLANGEPFFEIIATTPAEKKILKLSREITGIKLDVGVASMIIGDGEYTFLFIPILAEFTSVSEGDLP